jgi:lysophospholipase L1-like esterase
MADGRAGRIVVTTYAGPDEREVVTERFTRPVNDAIRRAAAGVPGVRVVDLEALFAGHTSHSPRPQRWIQWRDGVHPNARGHRAIAGAVLARLEAPPHG